MSASEERRQKRFEACDCSNKGATKAEAELFIRLKVTLAIKAEAELFIHLKVVTPTATACSVSPIDKKPDNINQQQQLLVPDSQTTAAVTNSKVTEVLYKNSKVNVVS